MSQFFINTDIDTEKRYDPAKFMRFEFNAYDPLSSNLFLVIKSVQKNGEIVVQGEEGRPDLLANRAYNDTQYWWVIMIYNDIFNVNDIVEGMKLDLVNRSELEDLYFSLKSKQVASENG